MKKNIAMRVAAFLFILTMITTCAFATTFAKYTTKGEAEDSARVAKWGVTVVVQNNGGSFQKEYDVNESEKTVVSAGVDAQGIEKLVAPGTSGHLVTITVAGTPEVSTKVTRDVNINFGGWYIPAANNTTEFYCPIVITYKIDNGEEQAISGLSYTSANDFQRALDNAFDLTTNNKYAPNANLARSLEISWAWAFNGDHVKDTALGNLDTAPTSSFTAECRVEQLD